MSALGRELPFQAITAEELERAEEIAQAAIEHDFNNYDGDEAQEWIIDNRLIPDFEKVAKAYLSLRSRVSVQQSKDDKPLADTLADIACGTPVPKGFGEYVDGTDGERIGTNIALWVNWRDFFTAMLQRTPLSPWWSPALRTEQAKDSQ